MNAYKQILVDIAAAIVDEPDKVSVTETEGEDGALVLVLSVAPDDMGKVIGKHIGVQYYTIGQRHGLNIGGHQGSIFIIATDIATNTIYVGEGKDHLGLYRRGLKIKKEEVHWIRPDLRMGTGEERKYLVRIRYRQPLQKATLLMRDEGMYILFDEPQRGVTPGQFAAWYAEDGEMLGSGPIME